MPIPKPQEGEIRSDYISRCMADVTVATEFPERDDRLEACSDLWDREGKAQSEVRVERKHIVVPFETKGVDEAGQIEGYGAAFDNVDHGLDVIEKGAFRKNLRAHKRAGTMPAMLFGHDSREPVGEWEKAREDDRGLFMSGGLWVDPSQITDGVRKARNVAMSNSPKGLSIGYMARGWHMETRGKDTVRVLTELDVDEVSIVSFPMNQNAVITSAKAIDAGELCTVREFEALLMDQMGLSRNQAKSLIARGWDGLRDAVAGKSVLQREAGIAAVQMRLTLLNSAIKDYVR